MVALTRTNERRSEMERITRRIDETHACYAICEKECPDGICEDNPACVCTASKMAMKPLTGVRGHRTHPGADPGAEGAGYGESANKRY